MAKGEKEHLKKRFLEIEWLIMAGSSAVFSVTAVMLTPFVMLYTKKIDDVDYNRYFFGIIMISVHMLSVVRIPFQQVVEAAGHFKQTRTGAILEVVFNIMFSLLFAYYFGIVGVLLGTAVAAIIRTTQFGVYACKKIINVSIWHMLKNYVVYFGLSALMIIAGRFLISDLMNSYLQWIYTAFIVFLGAIVIIVIFSLLFNYRQFEGLVLQAYKRRKKA